MSLFCLFSMHGIVIHCRENLGDPIMGDQLLADDLVSEEFTFDRWPLFKQSNIKAIILKQDPIRSGTNWVGILRSGGVWQTWWLLQKLYHPS